MKKIKCSFSIKRVIDKSLFMLNTKHQILPQNLINNFYHNFSIYSILLHIHSVLKHHIQSSNTITYNFSAFLILDKSRKIIRKKEDQFVLEMVQKVGRQIEKFGEANVLAKELYKITYAQLEKFIQLFDSRKGQFSYFEKALAEIQNALHLNEKDKLKQQETIKKMKHKMNEFQEKLIFIIKKYQEKTHISFSAKLKSKPFCITPIQQGQTNLFQNQNTQDNLPSAETPKLNNEKTSNAAKKPQTQKQTYILTKFGDVSVQIQAIQNFKKQIMSFKTKYQKMVCKTEMQKKKKEEKKNASGKMLSKTQTSKLMTESDVQNSKTLIKDQQTSASDVKYSIRLTRSKKKSKLNSSFSIFSQKSNQASFFLKSQSKASLKPDQRKQTITDCTINEERINNEETQKIIPGEFLRKRSSLLKNLRQDTDVYFLKKPNNSVYRHTNFSFESQRKSNQKRVSTAKPRQSNRKDTQHNLYLQRISQTQANIQDYLNQQGENSFSAQNNEQITECQQQQMRIYQYSRFRDEQQQKQETNLAYLKFSSNNKHSKNRRIGFSKKKVDTVTDEQKMFVPSVSSIQRKSSMWNQSNKQDKSINRTSFFRSSGYTQQKQLMKAGRTRFNNFNRKLNRQDSNTSEAFIDHTSTLKSIHTQVIDKDRMKKGIQFSQMAVTAKDCKQLFQEITTQSKLDQSSLPPSYLLNAMRQKYDLRFKSGQYQNQFDDSNDTFMNQRFLIIETDPNENDGANQCRGKWTRGKSELGEERFGQVMTRKFNQLGQKNLDRKIYDLEDDLQCINL